jgi:uncharacterized membrane protein YgcG
MRVTVSRMTACNAELREKAHKTRSGREPDPPKMVSGYYHHMTRIDSLAHQAAASTCPGATVSLAEKREIRVVRSKRGHLTSYPDRWRNEYRTVVVAVAAAAAGSRGRGGRDGGGSPSGEAFSRGGGGGGCGGSVEAEAAAAVAGPGVAEIGARLG